MNDVKNKKFVVILEPDQIPELDKIASDYFNTPFTQYLRSARNFSEEKICYYFRSGRRLADGLHSSSIWSRSGYDYFTGCREDYEDFIIVTLEQLKFFYLGL